MLQCQSSKFCDNKLFRRSSLLRIAHTLLQAAQVCLAKSLLYSSKSVSKDTQLTTQCLLILSSHHSSRPSGMQTKLMQQIIIHMASASKQSTHLKISSLSCFISKYYKRRLQVNLFNRIKDSLLIKTVHQLVFQCSRYLTIKRQRKDKSLLTRKRSVHGNKQLMHERSIKHCRAAAIAGRHNKLDLISGSAAMQRTMRWLTLGTYRCRRRTRKSSLRRASISDRCSCRLMRLRGVLPIQTARGEALSCSERCSLRHAQILYRSLTGQKGEQKLYIANSKVTIIDNATACFLIWKLQLQTVYLATLFLSMQFYVDNVPINRFMWLSEKFCRLASCTK